MEYFCSIQYKHYHHTMSFLNRQFKDHEFEFVFLIFNLEARLIHLITFVILNFLLSTYFSLLFDSYISLLSFKTNIHIYTSVVMLIYKFERIKIKKIKDYIKI